MTAQDISKILRVSLKKAYKLINEGAIERIPCGSSIRVAKLNFIRYYMQLTQISAE